MAQKQCRASLLSNHTGIETEERGAEKKEKPWQLVRQLASRFLRRRVFLVLLRSTSVCGFTSPSSSTRGEGNKKRKERSKETKDKRGSKRQKTDTDEKTEELEKEIERPGGRKTLASNVTGRGRVSE